MSLLGLGFTGVQFQNRPEATIIGSYVYGATFSLGWSACIGPILGSIMTLLATQGMGILQGTFLAFIYALGLGLPLILVATFFSRLGTGTRFWQFLRGRGWTVKIFGRELYLHSTSVISGLLLDRDGRAAPQRETDPHHPDGGRAVLPPGWSTSKNKCASCLAALKRMRITVLDRPGKEEIPL